MRKTTLTLLLGSTILLPLAVFAQGSLTPPGTPGPTMKSLEQIEPRVDIQRAVNPLPSDNNFHVIINAPGSYYLSANMLVSKVGGIHVTVPGVTLDLNGFEVVRSGGLGGDGILIATAADGCRVLNGSVKGFSNGVRCAPTDSTFPRGGAFVDLTVSGCLFNGLIAGDSWEITGCRSYNNAGPGILGGAANIIKNCVANKNAGSGIVVGPGSTMTGCTATLNTGDAGIRVGSGSRITDSISEGNVATFGIFADFGSLVSHCSARGNNKASGASYGIYVAGESLVVSCSSTNNFNGETAETTDRGVGIGAGNQATIRDCFVRGNFNDGIRVGHGCRVVQNHCVANGGQLAGGQGKDGAAIHLTSADNVVESNHVSRSRWGVKAAGARNLIIRNTAARNFLNYSIAAGNQYGPIVNITNVSTPAAEGNVAASTLDSADPTANLAQ